MPSLVPNTEVNDAIDWQQQVNTLDAIFSSSSSLVYMFDTHGKYRYASPASLQTLGLRLDEFVGRGWRELNFPEHLMLPIERKLYSVLQTGTPEGGEVEFPVVGGPRHFEYHLTPVCASDGRITGAICMVFDITDRKASELAVRNSEERLRQLFLKSPFPIYCWKSSDDDFIFVDANVAAEHITKGRIRGIIGVQASQLYHDDPSIPKDMHDAFANRTVIRREGLYRLRTTGEERMFVVHYIYVPPDLVMIHTEDVTELRQAEARLRASEERYRLMLEGTRVIVWEADPKTFRFTFVGGQVEALLGYDRSEWYTEGFWSRHVHPDDREQAIRFCTQETRDGRDHRFEYRMIAADGSIVWIDDLVTLDMCGAEPVAMRGVFIDITDRRRSEEMTREREAELAHVSRLVTLGELATGIAHELNQPLSAITTRLDAAMIGLRAGRTDSTSLLHDLEQSANQAERASEIIRRLRQFVKKREPLRSSIDINQLVRDSIRFLDHDAKTANVAIRYRLKPGLPILHADEVQIQQVLLNIMKNAIDAMSEQADDDRRIVISTRLVEPRAIEVAIRDNGPGIAAELDAQPFIPFYTTKMDGLGLGLPLSRTIIEAHQGRLWFTRNRGRGMTFRFTIPLAAEVENGIT